MLANATHIAEAGPRHSIRQPGVSEKPQQKQNSDKLRGLQKVRRPFGFELSTKADG
jgi:hypothetical protein